MNTWAGSRLEILNKLSPQALRDFIKSSPCIACGRPGVDIHHVKSVGSSGGRSHGIDLAYNLIPLDRVCHAMIHQLGYSKFFQKYPHVKNKLESFGWSFEVVLGKFKASYSDPADT